MVSIIIPFFKNKSWLESALDSVYGQSYHNFEVIVVDDGSKIQIEDLKFKYKNLQIIHSENKGPASARNIGIRASKGKYVAFLDSDDIWVPNKLEKQINFMTSEKYRWSATGYSRFKSEKKENPELDLKVKSRDHSGMSFWQIMSSTKIATPTVIIEREIFFDERFHNGFNEKLRIGEDVCMWLSLASTYPIGYIDDKLARIRLHGANAAGSCMIQITARTSIFNFVNSFFKEITIKMPLMLLFAYQLCKIDEYIINILKRKHIKTRWIEIISRSMYIIPWSIFKINSLYWSKR